jgi:hypothetical protein
MPIEYYQQQWVSFAYNNITSKSIPMSPVTIDASRITNSLGANRYIVDFVLSDIDTSGVNNNTLFTPILFNTKLEWVVTKTCRSPDVLDMQSISSLRREYDKWFSRSYLSQSQRPQYPKNSDLIV